MAEVCLSSFNTIALSCAMHSFLHISSSCFILIFISHLLFEAFF